MKMGPRRCVAAAWVLCSARALAQDALPDSMAAASPSPVASQPGGEPGDIPVDPAQQQSTDTSASTAAPSARNSLIEEVVVTAQKKSESINDVPIAISAFTGEDLKALGVNNTQDLGAVVPGFTANDSGFNTPIYTLRGVGFNDPTYTATATVGVYEDEFNLPYSIMTKGAALDIERIEVLKGPQGILYGRNTTGGAINYIAKKPTDSFEAGVTGTFGRFETADADGFVSGKLADNLNGRLAVKLTQSWEGDQYSNTRPDDGLGKIDKQVLRGSLEWKPEDDLSMRLVLNAWHDGSQPRASQAIFLSEQNPLDPTGVFVPPQARNYPFVPQHGASPEVADWTPGVDWGLDDRFYMGGLRTNWQITDKTAFTALLSAMRVESDNSKIPQSGYDFNNAEQVIDAHINTAALEMRLSGTAGENDQFDWMAGTNLSADRAHEYHLEYADMQSAFFPDPVTGESTLANRVFFEGKLSTDQYAAFVNTGWKFADDWKLTAGARFTQTNEHFDSCAGEAPGSQSTVPGADLDALFVTLSAVDAAQYTAETGQPGNPTLSISQGQCFTLAPDGSTDPYSNNLDEHNVSFRVALDWKPIEDYLFYASVGRGYKAGGFPVLTASSTAQLVPVTQEQLDAFEVGSKTSFLRHQLHTNVALYYYDYQNKQLLTRLKDPYFGSLPVLKNAPKSNVYGAEFDAAYAPDFIEGLYLGATLAYTHTEIREFTSLNGDGNEEDYSGKPFNFAPRFQYTLLINYTHPVNGALNFDAGADWYHSSATNATLYQDPDYAINAYGTLGARAGVSSSDKVWSASAFVRNLTNEFSTLAAFKNGDAVSRIAGYGRTWGMSFSYNWF